MLQYAHLIICSKLIAVLLPVAASAVPTIVLTVATGATAGSSTPEAVLGERFTASITSPAHATYVKRIPGVYKIQQFPITKSISTIERHNMVTVKKLRALRSREVERIKGLRICGDLIVSILY